MSLILTSKYNTTFNIDESDVIMWNEQIYQLLTQKERNGTYPVLQENGVRKNIKSNNLKFVEHQKTKYTGVPCTYYKLTSK